MELSQRLERERVVEVLCSQDLAAHFSAAVAWMREQGPKSEGSPVYIEAGEAPRLLEA
jgi:hypothetical protein